MTTEILTVTQAAEETGFHTSTISTWCVQGIIKGKKVKGRWQIERVALEKFKKDRENGHKPEIMPVPAEPEKKMPELSERTKAIHARAEQMVYDRQDLLAQLFPHPKPGEVYDYVLHNMAPAGLTKMPTLEDIMKEEAAKKEPKETEPSKSDGELGAKLARAEVAMQQLMEYPQESIQNEASALLERLLKLKATYRKIIEDYANEQKDKG